LGSSQAGWWVIEGWVNFGNPLRERILSLKVRFLELFFFIWPLNGLVGTPLGDFLSWGLLGYGTDF